MEKQFNDNDLIERYLEGSLDEKERESINKRIKTDTAFADALAKRTLLQKTYVEASRRSELKKHIQSIASDEKRKDANQRKLWLAAATLLILTTIGSIWIYTSRKLDNEQRLANEQYMSITDSVDQMVKGQQNSMNQYSSIDSINVKNLGNSSYPDEKTKFKKGDTICFSWPAQSILETLNIQKDGAIGIFKIMISPGLTQYLLPVDSLKPGNYSWSLEPLELRGKFVIQKTK